LRVFRSAIERLLAVGGDKFGPDRILLVEQYLAPMILADQ
jgi:hypothetical protein